MPHINTGVEQTAIITKELPAGQNIQVRAANTLSYIK